MARCSRLVALLVFACAALTPLHSSAQQPESQKSALAATASPCPARLVVRQVRIERVSDWARLDVTASIHRDCSEAPANALTPEGASERAPEEVQLTPWPAEGAILGLLEERSSRRLPAMSHTEARRSFYSHQWGPPGSRGTALLLDSLGRSQARIRVRPLGEAEELSFRYRALLPVEYDKGRWRLQLDGLDPETTVEFAPGLTPERQPNERGTIYHWTELGFGLQGELARIPWRDGTATLEWHLRVASMIRPVPVGARLVVLLDVSRSVGPEQLGRARDLAGRWLAGHPSPQVAVLAFDRRLRDLTSGFVSVDEALRALASPFAQGNGSFQELALARGARLLRGAGGEGRILLLSDGHVRPQLPEDMLAKALKPNGPWLLYGELPTLGAERLSRSELQALALAHGEHLRCEEGACDVAPLLAPTHLKEVSLTPPLYHAGISPWPLGSIPGGSRFAPFEDTLPTKAWIGHVRYRVWGTSKECAFQVDSRVTDVALAWRTAMQDSCRLEPRWADLSRAVTPEWSYVQRWPGALERYEPVGAEIIEGGCGAICDDCGVPGPEGASFYSANRHRKAVSGEPWWGNRWRQGVVSCGAKTARVMLWLDGPEIEEIELLPTGMGSNVDECLREFAWNLDVPAGSGAPTGGPFTLEVAE